MKQLFLGILLALLSLQASAGTLVKVKKDALACIDLLVIQTIQDIAHIDIDKSVELGLLAINNNGYLEWSVEN